MGLLGRRISTHGVVVVWGRQQSLGCHTQGLPQLIISVETQDEVWTLLYGVHGKSMQLPFHDQS